MENQKENTQIALMKKCEYCGKDKSYSSYDELGQDSYPTLHDDCRNDYLKREKIRAIDRSIEKTIPKKFINIDSDKIDLVEKYYNKSLFITGSVGTGKTVFMCSMIKKYLQEKVYLPRKENEFYDRNYRCKFISFPAWIMSLQGAFKHSEIDPFSLADGIAKFKGILAIDDLGAEKLTEWVKQIIYFVINEREQRELITLITSNFSLDEIDEQIDSRISSRIAGMCNILVFKGEDRRKQK